MVVLAWLLTLIFSWPQAVIFRVLKHPKKDFYQCTTFKFFENLAEDMGDDSLYSKYKMSKNGQAQGQPETSKKTAI